MSRVLPLSYVRPVGGTVAPGSILTCAGGRGDVGVWATPPYAELIDPSGTNTVGTLMDKHNELLWTFGLTRLLSVQPRMYFSTAGEQGIQIYRDGVVTNNGSPYAPYSTITSPYPSLSMSEFLSNFNQVFGNTNEAEVVFDGQRINLLFKPRNPQIGWALREPTGSYYGAAKRMLNRIFNRTDSDTTILDVSFTSPSLIQGAPLSAPVFGIFPAPAAVAGLITGNHTINSFDVSWDPVLAATEYYVRIQGIGIDKITAQTGTTYTVSTSDLDINEDVLYNINVVASTPFEISTEESVSGYIGAQPPDLEILGFSSSSYTSITVSWLMYVGGYDVNFIPALPAPAPQITSVFGLLMNPNNYTFVGLSVGQSYDISGYLAKFGIKGTFIAFTASTPQFPIPDIQSATATSTTTATVQMSTVGLLSDIASITFKLKNLSDNTNSTISFPYVSSSYDITDLLPGTAYSVDARFTLNNLQTGPYSTSDTQFTTDAPPPPIPNISSAIADSGTTAEISIVAPSPSTGIASIVFTLVDPSTTITTQTRTYSGGTVYTLTDLTGSTTYTLTAHYVMSNTQIGDESGPIQFTTFYPAVSPFGVFATNNAVWGYMTRPLLGPNDYSGFRVPSNSTLLGSQFNRIVFYKLPFPGYGNVFPNITSYSRSGYLQAEVYTDTSLSTLIASSNVKHITNNNNDPAEIYIFDTVGGLLVTLRAGMCIIFRQVGTPSSDQIDIPLFNNNGGANVPLFGIYGSAATTFIATDETSYDGPQCDFQII